MIQRANWRPVKGSLMYWQLIAPSGAVIGLVESFRGKWHTPAFYRVRGGETLMAPTFLDALERVEAEYGLRGRTRNDGYRVAERVPKRQAA